MKRAVAAIGAFLAFAIASQQVFAASPCETKRGHPIEVIPWIHLEESETAALAAGYQKAIAAAREGDCAGIKKALNDALAPRAADLAGAAQVYRKLEDLHRARPIAALGVEATATEFQDNTEAAEGIEPNLLFMERNCGSMLIGELTAYRLMIPGPEYRFARQTPGVKLFASEDEAAKTSNAKQFELKDPLEDLNEAQLSVQARARLDAIRVPLLQGQEPQSADIRAFALSWRPQSPADAEVQVRRSVEVWKERFKGVRKRNEHIAQRAIAQAGHVAVVIGAFHLPHLGQEIQRQCETLPDRDLSHLPTTEAPESTR